MKKVTNPTFETIQKYKRVEAMIEAGTSAVDACKDLNWHPRSFYIYRKFFKANPSALNVPRRQVNLALPATE